MEAQSSARELNLMAVQFSKESKIHRIGQIYKFLKNLNTSGTSVSHHTDNTL